MALIDGQPVIGYHCREYGQIKYAWLDGQRWQRVVVAHSRTLDDELIAYTSMAILPSGRPALCYFVDVPDYWDHELRYIALTDAGQTIHVDPVAGDDAWDGLCAEWDGDACGPKQTIQAGVDAAQNGQEVVLAPGTYTGDGNRDVDYAAKRITVRSVDPNDPNIVAATVIDCEGALDDRHRAFSFLSGEASDSVLAGLTIVNGHAPLTFYPYFGRELPFGGAVACYEGSPTLRSCVFVGNRACWGGAVSCAGLDDRIGSSPRIESCAFLNNTAYAHRIGGSIYGADGGALAVYWGSPAVKSCRFIGNSATPDDWEARGGALALGNVCHVAITECDFRDNAVEVDGDGGAVSASDADIRFENCRFLNNAVAATQGGYGGGAVSGESCAASVFANCLFAYNSSLKYGGALLFPGATLLNCTVTGNWAAESYDAIAWYGTIVNSVIWNGEDWGDPDYLDVTYSVVQGGWPGEGNTGEDPLFVNPDGPDGVPGTADDDYRLQAGSPAIDAGLNEVLPCWMETDLDGRERIIDGDSDGVAIVDMGAYERYAALTGDCNCDGLVDVDDVNAFVLRLTNWQAYADRYPGCPLENADASGDGAVDFGDINPFRDLVLGELR